MQYRKHSYALLFFILGLCLHVSGQQNKADYQILQSKSNDTLYLDFQIKRTSSNSYFMGGYNLVFNIDSSIIDTSVHTVINQGVFASSTSDYSPLQVQHIQPQVYQLILVRKFPALGVGIPLPTTFVKAGRLAFKIKRCGSTGLAYPNKPNTTIVDWVGNDVDENAVPITPINVTASVSPKAKITLSKIITCPNSTIDIAAESRTGFSNYSLYSKSKTGVVALVTSSQISNMFKGVVVQDTGSYFVTFNVGNCIDTTLIGTVSTALAPLPLSITASNGSPCLGDNVTYTASPLESSNKYVWKLSPSGTPAVFVGSSAGVGQNTVSVNFKGTSAYSVTISVQDTNQYGCAGPLVKKVISPTVCAFNADFEVNGSSFAVSSCQGTVVKFKDASTTSGGLSIVRWEWNFGPGALPDTFTTTIPNNNPPDVIYNKAGVVGVMLVITNNLGQKDTIIKSPTISVLAGLTETPNPTCGSSSCNEVNFNWQTVQGATAYQVRYKKGVSGVFTSYTGTGIGIANTYKVDKNSVGMGGTLDFNDIKDDTVYFQVRAVASTCDTTTSVIVFCRPSYCSTQPGCNLPPISIIAPPAACKGSVVPVTVSTTPKNFYTAYPNVVFSWDNGSFDTSHVHNVTITNATSQTVKLLLIDTLKTNCYSLNNISIPVTPFLTTKPDLGIQSLECDKVTFVWKHVAGAAKYQIKYSGSCIVAQDWVDAPLNGLAEFFEISGLPDNCQLNFKVRAVGGCNTTQSDTLISPPTCTCYIGHIASSNTKSCALDTVTVSVSEIQIPNWVISWRNPVTNTYSAFSKDSIFTYVPTSSNSVDVIKYIIRDPNRLICDTKGEILDTIGSPGNPSWNPRKTDFCIKDALFYFDDTQVSKPGYTFLGSGIKEIDNKYYFDASLAGIGTHTISYNACGSIQSHDLRVVSEPCVTTVVDAGSLADPQGLYTACNGTIYITDRSNLAIYRYVPGTPFGAPEEIAKSSSSTQPELFGNLSIARFGEPYGIVFDESTNNEIYFVDKTKAKVKRIVLDKQKMENVVGDIADDQPTASNPIQDLINGRFNEPHGLSIDPSADTMYVSDLTNLNIKSFTFKGSNPKIKLVAGGGNILLPARGKDASLNLPFNLAVDSLGISASDYGDRNLFRYYFQSDSVIAVTQPTTPGYIDGINYKVRLLNGVTPKIGEWIYFTDTDNYALRRISTRTNVMETVAGSLPPIRSNVYPNGTGSLGANGLPFNSRFSKPGPISFNIRGYIDILDAGPPTAVRRYYLPRWGIGTWDNFDTTYVANCDRDTITPLYGGGRLRVISGKDLTAVSNDAIFAPKDTGQYLLGYYLKIGRCDTTFLRKVYVRPQPKSNLKGDTVCLDSVLLNATIKKDTTLRYKWYGPVRTSLIASKDTSRSIWVTKTGKYFVQIYYGKKKQCFVLDSANVEIIPRIKLAFSDTLKCAGNATLFIPAVVDSVKFAYSWEFGVTPIATSAKAITSHTYSTYGTYKVTMIGKYRLLPAGVVCADTVTKSVKITSRPKVGMTINGQPDTAKFCGTGLNQADLQATVVNDVNAAGGPYVYKWYESAPRDGKLTDTLPTPSNANIAYPSLRLGEASSLFKYKVYVRDVKNCKSLSDSVFARVSSLPRFRVDASPSGKICKGRSVTFTPIDSTSSANKYSYKWDSSGIVLNADTSIAVITRKPLQTTTYTLRIKNLVTLCVASVLVPVEVTQMQIQKLSIPSPPSCAKPDSLPIKVTVTNSVLPYQLIQWTDSVTGKVPTTLFNPNSLNVNVWRDSLRTYRLVVKDNAGCSDTTFARVPVSSVQLPKFAVVRGRDTSVCVGGSVKIKLQITKGKAPYKLVWSSPSEVNTADSLNPIISSVVGATYPKKYIVTLTDSNNCAPVQDTVTITQYDMSLVVGTSAGLGLCRTSTVPNPTANLNVVVTNIPVLAGSTYDYIWTNSTTGLSLNVNSATISNVANAGKYKVQVVNKKTGCVRIDSTSLSILNAPQKPILTTGVPTISCSARNILLTASFTPPIKSKIDSVFFSWRVNARSVISTGNDSSFVQNLLPSDSGSVSFTVYTQNRCGIDSSTKVAVVRGTPQPNSDLKDVTTCVPNALLAASIALDTTLRYTWSGPNNILLTIPVNNTTRSISVTSSGKYWVNIYNGKNPSCARLVYANVLINTAGNGSIKAITPIAKGIAYADSAVVCYGTTVGLTMKEATTTQARFKKFVWNSTDTTRTILGKGTFTYKVTATDSIGCATVDSFKVVQQPLPISCIKIVDSSGASQTIINKIAFICPASTYRISDPCNPVSNLSSDSLIVKWQKRSAGGIFKTIKPNGIPYNDTATYVVTITPKINGTTILCPISKSDTITVKWYPRNSLKLTTLLPQIVCSGESIDLTATAGFQKYYWYRRPSNLLPIYYDTTTTNTNTTKIISADSSKPFSQSYGVIGVDQFGCRTKGNEQVKALFPVPKLAFTVESTCSGQATKFTPAVVDPKFVYTWDFGDPNSLTDNSTNSVSYYTYPASGTYKVKMSADFYITSRCVDTVQQTVTISVSGQVSLTINGLSDTAKFCGSSSNKVQLLAKVVPNPTNPNAKFTFKWFEAGPYKGGKLDSSSVTTSTTASPEARLNESSSLFAYSVRAFDAGNCATDPDTVYARVSTSPKFTINLSPSDKVCRGQLVTFTPVNTLSSSTLSNSYNYAWDTVGKALNSDITQPILVSQPLKTTVYNLNITNLTTSCTSSYTVPIEVLGPKVNIPVVPNPSGCGTPDSISIRASAAGAIAPYQMLQWTDSLTGNIPTTLYNPNLLAVKVWPDTLHTYKLFLRDSTGCADSAFVRVAGALVKPPLFSVLQGRDTGVCVNGSVRLTLGVTRSRGNYSFKWTDKNGSPITVDNSNSLEPAISVKNSGEYYVTMSDYNTVNCGLTSPKDSVKLTSYDMNLILSGLPTSSLLCRTPADPNPSASLQVAVTNSVPVPSANNQYTWTNSATGQILSTTSQLAGITDAGVYVIQVINTFSSCVRKDSTYVGIITQPENLNVVIDQPSVSCNNQPVKLKASFLSSTKALQDSITFDWSISGGQNFLTSFDSATVYNPSPSDTGFIAFRVIAKNRCGADTNSTPLVRFLSGARAKLDVSTKEVFLNKEVIFTNNSINTDSLNILTVGDGTNYEFGYGLGLTFTHSYSLEGKYKAILYVFNRNGCNAKDSVIVTVIDKINIFLPNVFSPSANEENNRFFRLYGLSVSPQEFSLIVYNRWGQLVYSTNDLYKAMNQGWDGTDSGGDAQMGVYTYILRGKHTNGVSINKTGTVSLIR